MEVYTGEDPYIFISYAHDDSERVLSIISHIANQEYRIWFDQRIEVGTKWAEVIAQRLNQSACFMAFIPDNYLRSDNCMDEIEHAKNKKIPILIIYLEDLQIPDWFLMRHGRTQSIYYKEYNTQNEFLEQIYASSILANCRRKDKVDILYSKIEKIEEVLENKGDEMDEQMEQISDEDPYTYAACLGIIGLMSEIIDLCDEEDKDKKRIVRSLREMMRDIEKKGGEKIVLRAYTVGREFLKLCEEIIYWTYQIPYGDSKKKVFELCNQLLWWLEKYIIVDEIEDAVIDEKISEEVANIILDNLIISYTS
mgnify:FL=1